MKVDEERRRGRRMHTREESKRSAVEGWNACDKHAGHGMGKINDKAVIQSQREWTVFRCEVSTKKRALEYNLYC